MVGFQRWLVGLSFLGTMLFLSCNNTKSVTKSIPSDVQMIVSLEKTGCYGTCPVYTLKVFSDQTISVKGVRNIAFEGERMGRLSDQMYASLIAAFEEYNFSKLDSLYDLPITDLPYTIITYRKGGSKTVKCRGDAPEDFTKIAELMESVLESKKWLNPALTSDTNIKEIILDLVQENDIAILLKAFTHMELSFLKRLGPNSSYYLFSLSMDKSDPENLLKEIKSHMLVKKAQWNHKLDKRN